MIKWPPGSASVIMNYGSVNPDPQEISGYYQRFKIGIGNKKFNTF
jgi:hypothetical protein